MREQTHIQHAARKQSVGLAELDAGRGVDLGRLDAVVGHLVVCHCFRCTRRTSHQRPGFYDWRDTGRMCPGAREGLEEGGLQAEDGGDAHLWEFGRGKGGESQGGCNIANCGPRIVVIDCEG